MIICWIIGKDRYITRVKVDAKKANFTYNNGLYTIPKEAVNLAEFEDGKKETYPELIYVSGVALPVNQKDGDVSGFLTETVTANALKQVARPKSEWLNILSDYMRNPNKLMMATFALIIFIAFIVSQL